MIRRAVVNDALVIAQLNEEHFHEAGRDFVALITGPMSDMYVMLDDEKIIGFTGLQANEWNQTLHVIDIFVHPAHRRQGIGHQLIQHLIQVAQATVYRCLTAEAPSLNLVLQLYLKNGFRICGYHDRYYTNVGPEVAIFVSLDLHAH